MKYKYKKVRLRRDELHESQETLAEKIGITRSYLSLIERGKRTPTVYVLAKIAEAMKVRIEYFFEDV